MIGFIDIKNGNIYNGNQPYVHWFDNGQSINLNYIKQLCIISDKKKLAVKCSDAGIFSLINPDKIRGSKMEVVNQFQYINLSDLKVLEYTSIGSPYNQYYIHMIYVLAFSSSAGQYEDVFYIDNTPFNIGTDFYSQNEVLISNLENFESAIPESIQRAIYDVNLHEEANDNITLNRKYKELLMNYMNIVGNKGSYESLLNSLKWFEWGDIVRMEEYWKRIDPHNITLLDREITEVLSEEDIRQLKNINKSTYIGLYCALQKFVVEDDRIVYEDEESWNGSRGEIDGDGLLRARLTSSTNTYPKNIDYNPDQNVDRWYNEDDDLASMLQLSSGDEDTIVGGDGENDVKEAKWTRYHRHWENYIKEEQNPALQYISSMWSYNELSLKMTLLGNFFSTYFMPIHLDLIHSTIEELVFTNTIKVLYTQQPSRRDYFDNIGTFDYEVSTMKVQPYTLFIHDDTMFKDIYSSQSDRFRLGLFGVDMDERDGDENIYKVTTGVSHIKINIKDFGDIKYSIIIFKIGEMEYKSEDWNVKVGDGTNISFDFNISLLEGHYDLYMQFYSTSGYSYTRKVEVDVIDDMGEDINLYYVNKDINADNLDILDIFYQQYDDGSKYTPQIQYLNSDSIGLNHVLMFDLDLLDELLGRHLRDIRLRIGMLSYPLPSLVTKQNGIWTIQRALTSNYGGYEWKIMKRYVTKNPYMYSLEDVNESLDETYLHYILVGINTSSFNKDIEVSYINDIDSRMRIVDEMRFIPSLHTTKEFDGEDITLDDTLLMIPQYKYGVKFNDYVWEIKNISTGDVYVSQLTEFFEDYYKNNKNEPMGSNNKFNKGGSGILLITPFSDNKFKKGYYDITFKYRMDNKVHEIKRKSAFRIV